MNPYLGQLRTELTLSSRQGEQLLVSLGIPLLVLVFFSSIDVLPTLADLCGREVPVDAARPLDGHPRSGRGERRRLGRARRDLDGLLDVASGSCVSKLLTPKVLLVSPLAGLLNREQQKLLEYLQGGEPGSEGNSSDIGRVGLLAEHDGKKESSLTEAGSRSGVSVKKRLCAAGRPEPV